MLALNRIFEPNLAIKESRESQYIRSGIFLTGLILPMGKGNNAVKGVKSLILESKNLMKVASNFDKGNMLTKEMNHLIEQFVQGNTKAGISPKHLFKDVWELRSRNGARVYYRMNDNEMEILGVSDKDTQKKVINVLRSLYDS